MRIVVSLAAAAALVLTAGACATPSAEKSSAEGRAAAPAKAESENGKRKKPWWRLSQYKRDTGVKPGTDREIRPGRGLFSGEDGYFVIYRKSDVPSSVSDSDKPSKVRR